jgi:hypothetical protein
MKLRKGNCVEDTEQYKRLACVCVCARAHTHACAHLLGTMCLSGFHRGQKRTVSPLELELWTILSYNVCAWN